jgi:serine/threonine-protein kinase
MQAYDDSDRVITLMKLLEAQYEFVALLGRGGSGLVFEVENRRLGRREALKFLSRSLGRDGNRRFVYEAKVMAGLDHPHIMPIYAFGEDEGCLWYSMRLVEGPTLGGYLKALRRLGAAEALQVAIPVMEALALAHDKGIVHRDIKPGNILLDPQAGPLVMDFGVAKIEGDPMQTETGMMLGTPAYVSPEQSLGRKVDGRTDLYAMGVTLYEVLTGTLPFREGNSLAIVLQRLQEEAPPLRELRPDVPEDLSAIIMRAMDRDADRRFPSALEMRDALAAAGARAGLDWRGSLVVPDGVGPRREALPEYLAPAALRRSEGSDSATSATPVLADPSAPTPPPLRRSPKRNVLRPTLMGVGFLALLLTGWGLLQGRRISGPASKAEPAPVAPVQAEMREAQPASPPRVVERARHVAETQPLLRRAVTPPQLLDPPKVPRTEGSPCLGQSVAVEVQVDEGGLVTSARLLAKVPVECADPALKAARACRFIPARAADGLPVASTVAIAIEF